VRLTQQEREALDGTQGGAAQKAMRMVTALGEIYGAEHLVPVSSAQISGVSYKNLGDAGIEFLEDWAAQGAQVSVPAFMNPAGMDLQRWQEMGIPAHFAEQQNRVIAVLTRMGVQLTCTCTPYLVGHAPQFGQHLAWSESSAVSYANSVVGACTNREGGPSALAAAIVGRTAAYGLHLPTLRRATHIVEVHCPVREPSDYGALGYAVGRQIGDGVPFFRFTDAATTARTPSQECLMSMGAAMAASGAVALYHIDGVTPEARQQPNSVVAMGASLPTISIANLESGYSELNSPVATVDFVSLGCPHSTPRDVERIACLLEGKHVVATLWITTSRYVRQLAAEAGWISRIEHAGGHVFADTCLVVAPVEELGFRSMATNSAKAAFYAPAHSGLQRHFGTTEQCIQAALTGRWPWASTESATP
jgi:predicted aconitase